MLLVDAAFFARNIQITLSNASTERFGIIPSTNGMNTCNCSLNSSWRTHQKFMLHIARLSSEFDRTLRVTVRDGEDELELP